MTLQTSNETQAAYLQALQGDPDALTPLVAQTLGSMQSVLDRELVSLATLGFGLEEDVLGKDGESIGTRIVLNPAAGPALRLAEMLGFTAAQQAVTPKSRKDGKTQDAATDFITTLAGLRRTGGGA